MDCYNLARVTLGGGATASQRAFLCAGTHDHRDPALPLVCKPVTVAAGAWVCAGAFVGPGVTVGANAVLGAHAVAARDVPPGEIWAGNPAKFVRDRVLIPGAATGNPAAPATPAAPR